MDASGAPVVPLQQPAARATMHIFSGRPIPPVDRQGDSSDVTGDDGRAATRPGKPPASHSAQVIGATLSYAAVLSPSQVRFVRTPDRVLRERRKAMADPKRPHDITADAPAESSPHASAKAQRQPRGTPRAHFGQGIAPTESHIAQAWTLPSWLQPFASSPDVRFTRTPETIIRRQNLPHPRLP